MTVTDRSPTNQRHSNQRLSNQHHDPREIWNGWVHFFLPCPCLGCGRPLAARAPRLLLCLPCRGALTPYRGPSCSRCARPLADPNLRLCTACVVRPPALELLWISWLYKAPLDGVVQALKFRRLEYLGRDLALAALEEIGSQRLKEGFSAASEDRPELSSPNRSPGRTPGRSLDLVVPVPLHWRRRLRRGYNQAEAIAKPLARSLNVPLAMALTRPRATPPQTGLGRRERLSNPRRAFRVSTRAQQSLVGKSVLLVDDVVTTGATLEAAARCLRQAGARSVEGIAIARSPETPEMPREESQGDESRGAEGHSPSDWLWS